MQYCVGSLGSQQVVELREASKSNYILIRHTLFQTGWFADDGDDDDDDGDDFDDDGDGNLLSTTLHLNGWL